MLLSRCFPKSETLVSCLSLFVSPRQRDARHWQEADSSRLSEELSDKTLVSDTFRGRVSHISWMARQNTEKSMRRLIALIT